MSRPRLLITRPAEDAAPLAAVLAEQGIDALLAPMLAVEAIAGPDLSLDGTQALLLTSANGARALAGRTPARDLPVFAVGNATAAAARAAGFSKVTSADGDVAALADLVIARLDPAAGAVLHAAASSVAGDLGGRLGDAGFAYRRAVLYRARKAEGLADDTAAALREGTLDGVLFFSPRTAATFVSLVADAGLADSVRVLTAFCLSPAVADAAESLPWGRTVTAASPDQQAMLFAVAETVSGGAAPATSASFEEDLMANEPTPKPESDADEALRGTDEETAESGEASPADETPADADPPSESPDDPPPARSSPVPPHQAAPRAPQRRGPGVFMTAAIAVVATVAVAAGTWSLWAPHLAALVPVTQPDPFADPRVADMQSRLAALESAAPPSLDADERLQAAMANASDAAEQVRSATTELETVSQRLSALENDMSGLQNAMPGVEDAVSAQTSRLSSRIDSLEAAVAGLEEAVSGRSVLAGTQGALLVALSDLRTALDGSDPFVESLNAVNAASGDDPAVADITAPLRPRAAGGIPTRDVLRTRFEDTARDMVQAATAAGGEGWADRALDAIKGLVNVRRVGGGPNLTDLDAAIAHAETALYAGDLSTAVASLEHVQGPAAEAAAGWIADARARVTAEGAVGELSRYVATMPVAGN